MSARQAKRRPPDPFTPGGWEGGRPLTVERVERVVEFHGEGLPVLSLYMGIPAGADVRGLALTKADSLLHEIRQESDSHSLEHEARLSLREDRERVSAFLEEGTYGPGALAIFSCSRAGFFEAVELPRAGRDRAAVGARTFVRPLLAELEEHHRCCALVLDRETAHAWELYLGVLGDAGELTSRERYTPTATARGNERVIQHRAEDQERRHFKHVASTLERLFSDRRYDVMAVGGHEQELAHFLELIPQDLRPRVAGTFQVDPETATPATIRDHAQAILDRYARDLLRDAVSKTIAAAAAGGHGAVGLDLCLWAGSVAAIQELYVKDGAVAAGVVCDESRWLGTRGERCPICGRPTRHVDDVIDELAEVVVEDGGSVHHLGEEIDLAGRPTAAALRFPLPPMPQAEGAET